MTFFVVRRTKMNDAKSMLMMYSYAAMKAAKDTTKAKEEAKAETKTKAAKAAKDTKQRGKKNDKGTERADSTITKE